MFHPLTYPFTSLYELFRQQITAPAPLSDILTPSASLQHQKIKSHRHRDHPMVIPNTTDLDRYEACSFVLRGQGSRINLPENLHWTMILDRRIKDP